MRPTADKTIQNRRAVMLHVKANPGCTFDQVSAATGIKPSTLQHLRTHLAAIGMIDIRRQANKGGTCGWFACDSGDPKPLRGPVTDAYPGVTIPPQSRWLLPAPEVSILSSGVKITRQASPRGRFDVDLTPGGGVISGDNPRLTAALMGAAT